MITRDLGKGYSYTWLLNELKFFKGEKMIEKHENIETIGQLSEKTQLFEKHLSKI